VTPARPSARARAYPLTVLIALNGALRRQRRRIATLTVTVGLAGSVVVAHSALRHHHVGDMGGAILTCLAVVETAVVAVGAAFALSALMRRRRRLLPASLAPDPPFVPSPAGTRSRAGPPLLQVFRL
jgi:hypothetical protein